MLKLAKHSPGGATAADRADLAKVIEAFRILRQWEREAHSRHPTGELSNPNVLDFGKPKPVGEDLDGRVFQTQQQGTRDP